MLTEVKTDTMHYFINEDDEICGELKYWRENGQLEEHCFCERSERHGERKTWHDNGQLWKHCFFMRGKIHGEFIDWIRDGTLYERRFFANNTNITPEVEALVQDINNLTDEERLLIKLTWGIECLPK